MNSSAMSLLLYIRTCFVPSFYFKSLVKSEKKTPNCSVSFKLFVYWLNKYIGHL